MFSCFLSQPTADDQRYPSTCPHLIEDHIRFQCKLGDFFSGIMAIQFSVINAYVDNVSGVEIINIALKWQGASIFHRIKENRGYLSCNTNPTIPFVRDVGNIVTDVPKHGIGGRFT